MNVLLITILLLIKQHIFLFFSPALLICLCCQRCIIVYLLGIGNCPLAGQEYPNIGGLQFHRYPYHILIWFLPFLPLLYPQTGYCVKASGIFTILPWQYTGFPYLFWIPVFNTSFWYWFSIPVFDTNFQYQFLIQVFNTNFGYQV